MASERTRSAPRGPGPLRTRGPGVHACKGAGTVVTGTLWRGAGEGGRPVACGELWPRGSGAWRAGARRSGRGGGGRPAGRAEPGRPLPRRRSAPGRRSPVKPFDGGRHDGPRCPARSAGRQAQPARAGPPWDARGGGPDRRSQEARQLPLEQPLLAQDGDRVVVRSIAPPGTLGGGVIDKAAARQRVHLGGPSPPKVHTPAPGGPLPRLRWRSQRSSSAPGHEPPRTTELDSLLLGDLRAAGLAVRVGDRYAHPDAVATVSHESSRSRHAGAN